MALPYGDIEKVKIKREKWIKAVQKGRADFLPDTYANHYHHFVWCWTDQQKPIPHNFFDANGSGSTKSQKGAETSSPNWANIATFFATKWWTEHILTLCHHTWIINEVLVNFKNWCHIWSSWLKNTPCTNFQRIPTLFDTRMTTFSLFYCTRRGMCHLLAKN